MWESLKLLRKLGEGGMGEVWLAYDRRTGAQVAAKRLKQDLIRDKDFVRFRREIEILQTAPHENIVKILDVSGPHEHLGYSLEYCPDGSLDSVIPRTSNNLKEAMSFFWQIVGAVEHLHSQKRPIIHRDIKPSNILLGADGNLKLSDFGLSRYLDETTRVTTSNWYSPGFSPPEQHEDFASADERSDLYSVGCTFFYLLTGTYYRPSTHLKSISDQSVSFILDSLLQRNPADRFQDVWKIRRAWNALTSQVSIRQFLKLSSAEKLARIKILGDIPYGPGDLELCLANRPELEAIIKAERDPAILKAAQSELESLEETEQWIADQMIQDNPP